MTLITHKTDVQRMTIKKFTDGRGGLTKIFENNSDVETEHYRSLNEAYISHSKKDVVRGLHFQHGHSAQEKLIYCVSGEFLDVSVDLRIGPSFGTVHVEHLTANDDILLRVPGVFAHGIISLADGTTYLNLSPDKYSPANEGGIHWASLGLDLNISEPILSEKDKGWPPLEEVLEGLSQ